MSTEEQAGTTGEPQPDWWHRGHPTFTALCGFFTGLVFVIVVPGMFVALLAWVASEHEAEDLFPLVLVTLVIPLCLLLARRTRRFGGYMLAGMALTAVVVGGVAGLVLWIMVRRQG